MTARREKENELQLQLRLEEEEQEQVGVDYEELLKHEAERLSVRGYEPKVNATSFVKINIK